MSIKAIIEIDPRGFQITVIDPQQVIPLPTALDEMRNPQLGVLAASSSMSTFVKALNDLLVIGTGQPLRPFALVETLRSVVIGGPVDKSPE